MTTMAEASAVAYRAYPIEAENALDAWVAARTEGVWTSPAGWWYAAWMHREAEVATLRDRLALAEQALRQAGHHEDRLLKNIEFVIRTFDSEDISPTPDQRDVIDDLRSALRHHKRLDETTPAVSAL